MNPYDELDFWAFSPWTVFEGRFSKARAGRPNDNYLHYNPDFGVWLRSTWTAERPFYDLVFSPPNGSKAKFFNLCHLARHKGFQEWSYGYFHIPEMDKFDQWIIGVDLGILDSLPIGTYMDSLAVAVLDIKKRFKIEYQGELQMNTK